MAHELPPHDLGPDDWASINQTLGLLPRELQVAQMICAGVRPKEIPGQLGVRAPTVRTYIRRIHENRQVPVGKRGHR